jgi:tRNA (guanine37-N1)-methyltransferase
MKKSRAIKKLTVDIVTIFPEAFSGYLNVGMLARAQKNKLLKVTTHQLRKWTHDPHQSVDDRPFGGGAGMLMKIAPFHEALMHLKLRNTQGRRTAAAKRTRVIVTSASGKAFTHADAVRLSRYDRLVFLCGRYEGIDERVKERLADESFRIGEYVLTGGELPALVMTDAIVRHIPGVLGKEGSLAEESWSDGALEYPQYTRPETYLGMKVPSVLLSGDHQKIAEWRKGNDTT